jgi:3-keto-disaccharide hydrolase
LFELCVLNCSLEPNTHVDLSFNIRIPVITSILRSFVLAIVLLILDASAPVCTTAQSIPANEVYSLFNGRTLAGWVNYGTEKWYVENGELVCESGPDAAYGYLGTDEVFGDFELTLEFLQEANGNSGVFFRSWVHGTRVEGWQVEVAPPGSNTGGIYESYGRGWLIQPTAEAQLALNEGEWNTMKIRAVGGHVVTWLNGEQMVELSDEVIGAARGRIALQIHDGGGIKVRWRNILIRRL